MLRRGPLLLPLPGGSKKFDLPADDYTVYSIQTNVLAKTKKFAKPF